MMNLLFYLLLSLLSPLVTALEEPELLEAIVQAKTPEEKGLAIAKMVDYRDSGWKDYETELEMILQNRQGQTSQRELLFNTMEVAGDSDKGLIIFNSPPDIKGTMLLIWSHALVSDDQWIFLPEVKRVKRITSKNKSGPFMGSEFAYEDIIVSQQVEKYTYKYLRDENYTGMNCYVIERYPAYEYSGYRRQVAWIDKKLFNFYKIDFYDRKDSLLKTLLSKNYQQYLNKYWRVDEQFIENHQTGKSTLLKFKKYQFGKGLTEEDFDKSRLR